jgi:putative addiction module killer protein
VSRCLRPRRSRSCRPQSTRWFTGLRDQRAKARILARIRRLSIGNFGDTKTVGGGVSELRIDYGPGYRIYFARRGTLLVLLLTGGDKSRQQADIAAARELAAQWDDE